MAAAGDASAAIENILNRQINVDSFATPCNLNAISESLHERNKRSSFASAESKEKFEKETSISGTIPIVHHAPSSYRSMLGYAG
jgi:hypothetical protein